MKKLFCCLFLIAVYSPFLISGETGKKTDTKLVNGIKHVYNEAVPGKGKVTLKLKKILTIDPGKGDPEISDIFFYDHVSDAKGNIYLIDGKSVELHTFSPAGKYIKSFLNKGQGPGEFGAYPAVQVTGSDIFIIGINERKVARYTTGGRFLREFKFRKYYHSISMIDNDRFIGCVFNYLDDKGKDFTKCLGIYTLDGQNPVKLFEAENAGRFFANYGKRRVAVYTGPGIYKDVLYAFDSNTDKLYISLSKDYVIYVKDLKGNTEAVIHKEHKNRTLNRKDKLKIFGTFGSMSGNLRNAVIDALPDRMCAIESMEVLSSGCLLVRSVSGYRETGYDIFSQKGEYIYSINLPEDIDLDKLKFYKGVLAGIENSEDTPVYHRFRIESLPEVF